MTGALAVATSAPCAHRAVDERADVGILRRLGSDHRGE